MMDGEVYADFALLWLVCHASRVEGDKPHECWLERWSQEAVKQGTRALDGLRDGVEAAITALGSGFLTPGAQRRAEGGAPRRRALRRRTTTASCCGSSTGCCSCSSPRTAALLHDPDAPDDARDALRPAGTRPPTPRPRREAARHQARRPLRGHEARHARLGNDDGCAPLGLPPLGSFLWSADALCQHLDSGTAPEPALLEAVRALATVRDGKVLRAVDYKNLGAEELGSVYESLLELHPELDVDAGTFALDTAAGNERKTTGSYYTPSSLISCLLDSALDPVLDEAAATRAGGDPRP